MFYSVPLARKSQEEKWRAVLMGEARGHMCWTPWMRRISRAIPSDPRCKLCDTPFGRPGNVMRYDGVPPFPETQAYVERGRAYMHTLLP